MPPSPRLSARRINSAYLIEMIRISAHRISDTTPRMACVRQRPAMGGGLGGFLQRVEGTGADIAIDDAEGADRGCCGEGGGMAGGCNWRTGHWRPQGTPAGHPTAHRACRSPFHRARSSASVRRDAANYHGIEQLGRAKSCAYGVRSAVTRRASRIIVALEPASAQAGSFKVRPGLLRAILANAADIEPVSLGEGLGYAGFDLGGKAGKNGERGGDERGNSDGGKCLDHDGPLSWAVPARRFVGQMSNQRQVSGCLRRARKWFHPGRVLFRRSSGRRNIAGSPWEDAPSPKTGSLADLK